MLHFLRLLSCCILSLSAACLSCAQGIDTTLWVIQGSVKTLARHGNTAYLGGDFSYLGRLTGGGAMLNTADGHLVNHHSLNIRGHVLAVAPDENGGWYIGGNFTEVQGVPRNGIAHILSDNTLDTAWNPAISYRQHPYISLLVYAGHTLYLSGSITGVNGVTRNRLAAIDMTTGQLSGWAPDPDSAVNTLEVVGDVIYAGGDFTRIGGKSIPYLAALDAATGMAKDWEIALDGGVNSMAHLNGKLYCSGSFGEVGGKTRFKLAAIDIASASVTNWQESHPGAEAIALAAYHNTIFVRGWFESFGGKTRKNIAAIDAVTGEITDWNPVGVPEPSAGLTRGRFSIIHNTVYLGGTFFSADLIKGYLMAIDATTGERLGWDMGADGMVGCVAASEKSVFAGGVFNSVGGEFRRGLGAIDLSRGQVTGWNPAPDIGSIYKIIPSGGLVYVAGVFSAIGGQSRNGLAAVDTASGTANGWNPDLVDVFRDGSRGLAEIRTIAIDNGLLYAGGHFTNAGSQARKNIAAFDLKTGEPTAWKPDANGVVNSIVVSRNLVYAGGEFTVAGGKPRTGLAALDRSAGMATSWFPVVSPAVDNGAQAAPCRIYSLHLLHNQLYIGGYFSTVNGQNRYQKAAFDIFTGRLLPWSPEAWGEPLPAVVNSVLYGQGGPSEYMIPLDWQTGKATAWNITPLSPFSAGIKQVLEDNGCYYLDGILESVSGPYNGTYVKCFALNTYAQAPTNARPVNLITGRITEAGSESCSDGPAGRGLKDIVVVAEPGPYYGLSDSAGHYTIAVDTGAYTVRQLLPEEHGMLTTQVCPSPAGTHTAAFNTYHNTAAGKHFSNRVTLRPYLTAGVASARRRRCFPATTTLTYCNAGSAAAGDVKVHLELPPYVVLVSAGAPYTVAPDKHYVFAVGSLPAGKCGTIELVDSVVCNNPDIRGLTQCTKVWITPANPTTPPADWDRSDIALKARCLDNGRVKLGLYNTGTGAMTDSSACRIYLDAELVVSRQYRLAAGDSLMLQVPANGQTVRLEADQRPGHPGKTSASVSIEACGTNAGGRVSLGFLAQLPADDPEPEVDVECLPITDSYDPNDKLVLPAGVSPEHYTDFGQELEYTVRFQNTGNDYAYLVVVTDTLSGQLDLATLRVTGASHPYKFTVSGRGRPVLTFTFNNINLPDSARDQAGSNGFVKFTIKPVAGLPEFSRIENFADIFFDYNPPVRTNTVHNTLYVAPREASGGDAHIATVCLPNLPVAAGENRSFCEQDTFRLQAAWPRYGQGRWRLVGGSGLIGEVNNPYSPVTQLGYGVNTFQWSIADGNCATDSLRYRVSVTRHRAPQKPAIAYTGINELTSGIEGDAYHWYCGGIRLPDNTRTIRATRAGSYSVRVAGANCTSVPSDPLDFRLTSPVMQLLTRVYPNPAAGDFTVAMPAGTTLATITVFDAPGKKVLESSTTGSGDAPVVYALGLTGYAAGVYLVKIQTKEAVVVKRILLR